MSYSNANNTKFCVPAKSDTIIYKYINTDQETPNLFNYDGFQLTFGSATFSSTTVSIQAVFESDTVNQNYTSVTSISDFYNKFNTVNSRIYDNFNIQLTESLVIEVVAISPYHTISCTGVTGGASVSINNYSQTLKTKVEQTHEIELFANTKKTNLQRIAAAWYQNNSNNNYRVVRGLDKVTTLTTNFNIQNDNYVRFDLESIYKTLFANNIIDSFNTNENCWMPLNSIVLKLNEKINGALQIENDFTAPTTFNNIFNLINARVSNNLYSYNYDASNVIFPSVSTNSQNIWCVNFNINPEILGKTFTLTARDFLGATRTVSVKWEKITNTFDITGSTTYNVRYSENTSDMQYCFSEVLNHIANNQLIFQDYSNYLKVLRSTQTMFASTCLVVVDSEITFDILDESYLQIRKMYANDMRTTNTLNEVNTYLDYNNNLKNNLQGVGFITAYGQTPFVSTFLNKFIRDISDINLEGNRYVQLLNSEYPFFNYGGTSQNSNMMPAVFDYQFYYNNNTANSSELLKVIYNFYYENKDNFDNTRHLAYTQFYKIENAFNQGFHQIGFRNKFGTLAFITSGSKANQIIGRTSIVDTNNKLNLDNLFATEQTDMFANVFSNKIVDVDTTLAFELEFPFNENDRDIYLDFVETDHIFYLAQSNNKMFNLNIQQFSFEGNVLKVTFAYIDNKNKINELKNNLDQYV